MPRSSRDEEFSAFVQTRRTGLVRSACLLTAGDTHLAEDLVQTALARLYALGLDAFRVAVAFENGPPRTFDLDGATGHISLAPGRQFVREGKLAVYRNGELVPLETAP